MTRPPGDVGRLRAGHRQGLRRNTRQFFRRVRGTLRVAGTEKAVEYGREIEFVEAKDNRPEAFECEPNPKKMDGGGPEFRDASPDCPIHVVSPRNCRTYFLSESPH